MHKMWWSTCGRAQHSVKNTDFNIHFDYAFATMNHSKFEDWFARMASRVYGTDFEPIKAGGKGGDKKSDGRRISTETVYQCYAPESPATFAAKAKAIAVGSEAQ